MNSIPLSVVVPDSLFQEPQHARFLSQVIIISGATRITQLPKGCYPEAGRRAVRRRVYAATSY